MSLFSEIDKVDSTGR